MLTVIVSLVLKMNAMSAFINVSQKLVCFQNSFCNYPGVLYGNAVLFLTVEFSESQKCFSQHCYSGGLFHLSPAMKEHASHKQTTSLCQGTSPFALTLLAPAANCVIATIIIKCNIWSKASFTLAPSYSNHHCSNHVSTTPVSYTQYVGFSRMCYKKKLQCISSNIQ